MTGASMDRETGYITDNLKWCIFKHTCVTFYIYHYQESQCLGYNHIPQTKQFLLFSSELVSNCEEVTN